MEFDAPLSASAKKFSNDQRYHQSHKGWKSLHPANLECHLKNKPHHENRHYGMNEHPEHTKKRTDVTSFKITERKLGNKCA